MTTNAELIAHGRAAVHVLPTCNCTRQLADALEAAEAQVARLRAQLGSLDFAWAEGWDCSASPGHVIVDEAFKRVALDQWPADLLAAVRHLSGDFPPKFTIHDHIRLRGEAVATLTRYGLLAGGNSEGGKDG